jgi:hypothetical protein
MVIPPEGVHLDCPAHPEGHHVFGSGITWNSNPPLYKTTTAGKPWCEYEHDPSKDLTFDSTRPFGTATGINIFDKAQY